MASQPHQRADSRRLDIKDLLNDDSRKRRRRGSDEERPAVEPQAKHLGLVTKTIVKSPEVKYIFNAQLRHHAFNDLVFVKDDQVEIHDITADGGLRLVASRLDIESRIRCAAVIGHRHKNDQDNGSLEVDKLHIISDQSSSADSSSPKLPASTLPPHILALVLGSGEVRFMVSESFRKSDEQQLRFFESTLPLPRLIESLETPGAHIAVDPLDRAMAVAAHYGNIVIFKLKSRDKLQQDFDRDPKNWTAVTENSVISIDGALVKIAFLYPENGNSRQVFLLVVAKTSGNRFKLYVYEWDHQNHIRTAHARLKGLKLPPEIRLPQLIIPDNYSPHFIWVANQDVFCFEDVLNGSPNPIKMERSIACEHPRHWARSDRLPVYTQWARAHRYHPTWREARNEELFLAREDGIMHQIKREGDVYTMSKAGNIHYNSSTAFTTFLINREDYAENDLFVFGGDQCPGEVCQIGYEAPPERGQHATRASVMSLRRLKTLPNWSSVLDATMVPNVGEASGQTQNRHNLVFTSGLQPYGALSEFRRGLKAKIKTTAQLPYDPIELQAANGLWIMRDSDLNAVIFISVPGRTEIFGLLRHGDPLTASFDYDPKIHGHETLLVARTPYGDFLQVTKHAVLLLRRVGFNDPVKDESGELISTGRFNPFAIRDDAHIFIRHAAYDPENHVLAMVREPITRGSFSLDTYCFPLEGEPRIPPHQGFEIQHLNPGQSTAELQPTCVAAANLGSRTVIAVGFAGGSIQTYVACRKKTVIHFTGRFIVSAEGIGLAINSIAMLSATTSEDKDTSRISLLCGSRTGMLQMLTMESDIKLRDGVPKDSRNSEVFTAAELKHLRKEIRLGTQPVKLQRCQSSSPSPSIIATCENDVLQVSLTASKTEGPDFMISSVWFWNEEDHSIPQPQLSTLFHDFAPFASPDAFPLLAALAGSDLHFTSLSSDVEILPRRRPLEDPLYEEKGGTPRIVTYCPRSDMMIVATSVWNHTRPAQFVSPVAPYKGTRAVHAALCFLPAREQDRSSPVDMETVPVYPLHKNEKIMAMIQWTSQKSDFLILGFATMKEKGEPGGRLMILKLRGVEGVNVELEVAKNTILKEPVRAVAELSGSPSMSPNMGITDKVVIGVGKDLCVYEFTSDRRWREICKQQLRSPAVQITCKTPYIYVSTEQHSIQVWRFDLVESADFQTYALELISSDDRSAQSSCHIVMNVAGKSSTSPESRSVVETSKSRMSDEKEQEMLKDTLLMTTDLQGRIRGLIPSNANSRRNADARILFEATIRQPITKLVKGSIRPPWRTIQHKGALIDDIIGCGLDGSFYSLIVVDAPSRTLLKYLENLVNWAKHHDRVLPRNSGGIESLREEAITIDPARDARLPDSQRPSHYHINGDLLDCFIVPPDGLGEVELSRLLHLQINEEDSQERYRGNIRAVRGPRFIALVKEVCTEDVELIMSQRRGWSSHAGGHGGEERDEGGAGRENQEKGGVTGDSEVDLTEQEAIRICIRWLRDLLQPVL